MLAYAYSINDYSMVPIATTVDEYSCLSVDDDEPLHKQSTVK